LANHPAGATIDATSGRVMWTPGSEHAGSTLVFQASVWDGLANATIPLEIRVLGSSSGAYADWVQNMFKPARALDASISGPTASSA